MSKKTTEVTNTKQIETRVKRQVVLEDGKVVEDSGPMVTTNTTEDTETQEHHQTEVILYVTHHLTKITTRLIDFNLVLNRLQLLSLIKKTAYAYIFKQGRHYGAITVLLLNFL